MRDQGHVLHVEVFGRPAAGDGVTLDQLEEAAERLRALDWKVNDVVVVPVRELPEAIPAPSAE